MKTKPIFLVLGILSAWFIHPPIATGTNPFPPINPPTYPHNVLILIDVSDDMAKTADGTTYVGGDDPSSRMSMMKDAIQRTFREVGDVANWGFMTFYQRHKIYGESTLSYFPYYRSAGPTPTTPTTVSLDYRWLQDRGFFSVGAGPAGSFYMSGVTYTIVTSTADDSRFRRAWRDGSEIYNIKHVTKDYVVSECSQPAGEGLVYCDFVDPDDSITYTWIYENSYYAYPRQDEDTATIYNFDAFHGPQFVDFDGSIGGLANTTYVYPTNAQLSADANNCDPPTILCNIDATPENEDMSCGLTDPDFQYGPTSDYAKGVLLERISTSADPNVQEANVEDIIERMSISFPWGVVPRGFHRPTSWALANCIDDVHPVLGVIEQYFDKSIAGIPPAGTITSEGYTWTLVAGNNSKYCCTGTMCPIPNCVFEAYSVCGETHCMFGKCVGDLGAKCDQQTWTYQGANYSRPDVGATINYNDAFHYFYEEVIPNDQASLNQCRRNYIILLGGGYPDSPHDPQAMWTAATRLKEMRVTIDEISYPTPVTTYVLTWVGLPLGAMDALNQLAANAGTGQAYFAANEAEFEEMLHTIISEIADYNLCVPEQSAQAKPSGCAGGALNGGSCGAGGDLGLSFLSVLGGIFLLKRKRRH